MEFTSDAASPSQQEHDSWRQVKIANPKSQSQTPNPKPQTPNPKPQTQIPNPKPKPQTPNPKLNYPPPIVKLKPLPQECAMRCGARGFACRTDKVRAGSVRCEVWGVRSEV